MAWTVGVVPRQPAWRFAYASELRVVAPPAPPPPPPVSEPEPEPEPTPPPLDLDPPAPLILVIEPEPEPAPPILVIEPESEPEPEPPIRFLVASLPLRASHTVYFTPPPPSPVLVRPSPKVVPYVPRRRSAPPLAAAPPLPPPPAPITVAAPPAPIVVEPPLPPVEAAPILEVELETRWAMGCVSLARTYVVTFQVAPPEVPVLVLGPRERSRGVPPERTYVMRGFDVALQEMVTWSAPIADALAAHYGGTGPVDDIVIQRVVRRR